jgi:cytochrome c oxidase assembly factor CtaG
MAGTALAPLVAAYAGPPAWTMGRVFSEWQADPVVLPLVALSAAGYAWGLVRVHRSGASWSPGRTLSFAAGLMLWVFTVCSGVGVYEKVLFTDRALQSVLLLMVVPLLLALGAPVSLLDASLGERGRARLRAVLGGRISTLLMFPLVSTVLLLLPPWLLYFTPWYRLSLTSTGFNILFHVAFVLLGLAYFWPRLQIDPVAKRYHPLLSILISVVEVLGDAALGLILVFGSHLLIAGYWQHLARPWGMAPLDDQKWGGAVLWGLGDIAGVPFLAALIARVIREEKAKTVEVDRRLDAQAEAEGTVTRMPGLGDSPVGPELTRPWWETDPRFAHRYGPRDEQPEG